MSAKSKIALGLVLIAAAFLAGFVPQFLEKRYLRAELENTRMTVATAQLQMDIDKMRTLAGRILLAASRQNYGMASTYSTKYFDGLSEIQSKTENDSLKTSLSSLLNSRDSITSSLAQGNASIIPELQSLLESTYDVPNATNAAH